MPDVGSHVVGHGSNMPREAHQPYRFGMTLLCFGGLLNWVGLFENYTEPVRYIGVACVVSGAVLLCFAICCWLRPGHHRHQAGAEQRDPVHFITVDRSEQPAQKPPDYESVTDKPPTYDDAIKLSPALLWLANEHELQASQTLAGSGAEGPSQELTIAELEDIPGRVTPPPPPPPPPPPSRCPALAPRAAQSSEVATMLTITTQRASITTSSVDGLAKM